MSALSELEQKFYDACVKAGDRGLTSEDYQEQDKDCSTADIAVVVNGLLKRTMIEMFQIRSELIYKAVKADEAGKLGNLEGDEKLIYMQIKASGNEGIWTKHLKTKTNLHQNVIVRCLKLLEQKSLVKAIKSVKNPTRKVYMLMELTPSIEVTGGPWFTDQELDLDFVEQLTNQCFKYILMKSFPARDRSKIFTVGHNQYPSAAMVRKHIMDMRISQVDLTVEDITMLLDVLVFDGKVERFISMTEDDWDDDEDDADWVYKAIRDTKVENSWQECPCGVCPVADFCSESGPVNPGGCGYYAKWLEF